MDKPESELRSPKEASTRRAIAHIQDIRQQMDDHEAELNQMMMGLTNQQMETMQTLTEFLWGESYRHRVFNQSTVLTIMKERLNLRQRDIQLGRSEGIAEAMNAANRMLQEGKINREQLEYFLKYMAEEDEKQKSSTNLNV